MVDSPLVVLAFSTTEKDVAKSRGGLLNWQGPWQHISTCALCMLYSMSWDSSAHGYVLSKCAYNLLSSSAGVLEKKVLTIKFLSQNTKNTTFKKYIYSGRY